MEIQHLTEIPEWDQLDWLVLFVSRDGNYNLSNQLPPELQELMQRLLESKDLPVKAGEKKTLLGLASPLPPRILLVGIGDVEQKPLDSEAWYRICCIATRALSDQSDLTLAWILPELTIANRPPETLMELASTALEYGVVSQAVYTREKKRSEFESVSFLDGLESESDAIVRGRAVGRAINQARDLINRCAEEITPEAVANRASLIAGELDLHCEIFDETQLDAERMHSMLSVARGSGLPPRMVKLEYRGAGDAPFLSLVGKGVTYDSGGLSIKPTDSMKTMKSDMSGAATVLAILQAAAELHLRINIRGYMGLVENMISGRSYRVGDVLTARNGTTIEVLNTDAEGRLVLADVLSYAVDEGCEKLIDFATLTGSCVVALGEDYSGLFTNDESWLEQFTTAALMTGEKVWSLPMDDSFNDQLKSDVADCKNVGTRWGGSITAAKFLQKFVGKTPWIHCDIAGPAFRTDSKPEREGGASGVLIRTVLQLLDLLQPEESETDHE